MSYQILEIPWEEYAKPGFIGSSALHAWHSQECGKEAWAERYLSGGYGKSNATPAMVAGSALDLWITGGFAAFSEKYVKVPSGIDFRTTEGKAWKSVNAGKGLLDASTFEQIEEAVRRASDAISIIGDGENPQYQATMRGVVAGVQVQTRPDILFPGSKWFRDLKYVNSGSFVGFDRHFVGSRYFLQAGLFAGLTDFDYRVSFLLVESGTMSPRIRDVEIPERVLRAGWRRVESICASIRESMDSPLGLNDLPRFDVLDLPAWAEKEIDA